MIYNHTVRSRTFKKSKSPLDFHLSKKMGPDPKKMWTVRKWRQTPVFEKKDIFKIESDF